MTRCHIIVVNGASDAKYSRRERHVTDNLLPAIRSMGLEVTTGAVTPGDFTREGARVSYGDKTFVYTGWGSVENFLSHYVLWKRVVAGTSPLLVLEDDVNLPNDRNATVIEAITLYEKVDDSQVLYLQTGCPYTVHAPAKSYFGLTRCGDFYKVPYTWHDMAGTAAYCINKAAAAALIQYAESGFGAVDAFMHQAMQRQIIDYVLPDAYARTFLLDTSLSWGDGLG